MTDELSLSDLPQGWVGTKVGEIYDIVGGGTPSTKVSEYWEGDIPWITSADIYDLKDIRPKKYINMKAVQNSATNLVPEESLAVVTRVGLGKVVLIQTPICFNQDIQALVGNRSLIYPEYSVYYLSQAVQIFKYEHRGTTIAGVTKKQLAELPFALPPLPEQLRIVAKIEELFTKLDAGIELLKKIKAQLRRYRQAVLKYAFEGKLTEKWRETHKHELEPASVLLDRIKEDRRKVGSRKYMELSSGDISDLHELPELWSWTELNHVAEFKNGINFNKKQKGDKGILTIDVLNMYSKSVFVDLTKLYRVDKPVKNEYLLRYGDILFVRSSVKREGVGWSSGFKEISEPVTFCGFIIRGRLQDPRILPEYLTYFLRMDSSREVIIRKGSQVTITNISQDSLGRIQVPIAPANEQHKIVEEIERHLSVADEFEMTVENGIKQAERLRQSILKRAFGGKLVPQDPSDEPASVLLERIKAERAGLDIKGKARKKSKGKVNSNQMRLI